MICLVCKYYNYKLSELLDVSVKEFYMLLHNISKIEKLLNPFASSEDADTKKVDAKTKGSYELFSKFIKPKKKDKK